MNELMLSIIIPVYNAEKYLADCISSVLNQTISAFELILVDDGSSDFSLEICNQYAQRDKRIKIITQSNEGVSSARYKGLSEAKAEYVSFIDNDDLISPEMYSNLLEMMEENIDITCSSRIDLYDNQISHYKWSSDLNQKIITTYDGRKACEALAEQNTFNIRSPIWGRLYRKDFLIYLQLERFRSICPTLFFEDIFVMPIILNHARKVRFTNEVMYIHREVNTSISRSGKLNSFYFEQIDSYAMQLKYLKENKFDILYQIKLIEYSHCLMRLWYRLKYDRLTYPRQKELLFKINNFYDEFYNEILFATKSKVQKWNAFLFAKKRRMWELTVGNLYFKLIHRIKKYKTKNAIIR